MQPDNHCREILLIKFYKRNQDIHVNDEGQLEITEFEYRTLAQINTDVFLGMK